MTQRWQSYDAAAATHDRLAVRSTFADPARDLVSGIGLPAGGTILDVGSGTGIAARLAMQSASPETVVVALDPSLEMLRVARSHGLPSVVAGAMPGLPFADGAFDRVLANFVLSHVPSYRASLLDMARVLRPGGKVGVTTWGTVQNEFRETWQNLAESFVDKATLGAATQEALPWEDWFTDPAHLEQAFQEAGLHSIELHHRHYHTRMTIAEFLETRETSIHARFMRQTLTDQQWEQFKQTLATVFYSRFTDPIEHTRDVHITIGTSQSALPRIPQQFRQK